MRAFVLASVFAVSGCASVPETSPYQLLYDMRMGEAARMGVETTQALQSRSSTVVVGATQGLVRDGMRDPESAKFRRSRIIDYSGSQVVCGEVNGKNAYGGYTGYQPFIGSPESFRVIDFDMTTADGASASAGYRTYCLLGTSR